MKLINESLDYNISNLIELEEILNSKFKKIFPPSLKEIVIAPGNHEQYTLIAHKYDCNAKISKGENYAGYAITINLMKNNIFEQFIIIKDTAFFIAINSIIPECIFKKEEVPEVTTEFEELFTGCLFHEIGHSIDNYYRYKIYREEPSTKKFWDLSNPQENSIFFKNDATTLWSEFYAQLVSEQIKKQNHLFFINELNGLRKKHFNEINTNDDTIDALKDCYRVAYNLSLVTARIIANNKEITNKELVEQLILVIYDIDDSCIKYSQTLYELYLHIDHWILDNVKKFMANAYLELIQEFTENKIKIIKFDIDKNNLFTDKI